MADIIYDSVTKTYYSRSSPTGTYQPYTPPTTTTTTAPKTTTTAPKQDIITDNVTGNQYSRTSSTDTYKPYTAPTGTITPESLKSTQPFPLVSANTTPTYNVSNLQVPQLEATPQEEKASSLSGQLGDLYNSMVGKSQYQSVQNEKYGVNAAQASIQDLSAQLTGLKNEAAAIPLQLQQGAAERGVTLPQLGRQENSRLRTNAIAALGVSTLLAASQGQLANAQAMANQAVSQKYDPILERIEATKANLELILNDPLTSLQDKNRALEQQAIQDAKEQQVTLDKQNASEIWSIATTAASNANDFTPTGRYSNLATTLQAISQAETKEDALQIATATRLIQGPSEGSSTTSGGGIESIVDGSVSLRDLSSSERQSATQELSSIGFDSDTPPDWFRDYIQNQLRQSLTAKALLEEWIKYRDNTLAGTATSTSSGSSSGSINFDDL